MRIVYMGTGDIGLPSLRWLIGQSGRSVVAVYTQPDKPVGRKQVLTAPEVKRVAQAAGIPVFQPERLRKNADAIAEMADLDPDLIVLMAYGQILPPAVIGTPAIAAVNLHASLLPRHRGASPIQAAILAGDRETGITLMHIAPALDAGDAILKESIPIQPGDTGGALHDKLALLGPVLLEKGLPLLETGRAPRVAQEEALATYAPKLERCHGEIDWSRPAAEIARLIRAYDPWPGTYTRLQTGQGPQKLKIYPFARAVAIPAGTPDLPPPRGVDLPGTIHATDDSSLTVATGAGLLRLEGDLQLEGRKRLPAGEFLRGNPLFSGKKLGVPAT